jgi:tRNA A37 threonylcarbamoyladenosine modification protein TsaB
MPGKTTLWLDTSTQDTNIALVREDRILALRCAEANALAFLFDELASMLLETGIRFPDIHSLHYVCGPGSSLGLRIACMAISTWKTAYPGLRLQAAHTLPAYAALHGLCPDAPPAFTLLAQHRKDTWYQVAHENGNISTMNTLSDDEVSKLEGNLYHLPQRKFATSPPTSSQPLSPYLPALTEILQIPGLFQTVEKPTVFPEIVPTFKKWVPQRHSKAASC